MIRAAKGDTVKVHYTGRLADGTVFDASPPQKPLRFILGRGEVISGFDEAVTGMYRGESRAFTISPEKAYGAHDPSCVEEIARDQLPSGLTLQVGRQLEITAKNGNKLLVMISAVSEKTVTLDGNHPLAGKPLEFDIELLDVEKEIQLPPSSVLFPTEKS